MAKSIDTDHLPLLFLGKSTMGMVEGGVTNLTKIQFMGPGYSKAWVMQIRRIELSLAVIISVDINNLVILLNFIDF